MKPVEIELLMRDRTKSGPAEAGADREIAARQKAEEQVVAVMKEGYAKQRAEAELNFRREKQRIASEEQERLALYERLRAAGGQVHPEQQVTILAQAHAERIQAALALDRALGEIDKKEVEDNRRKLEQLLETYKDYATRREEIERRHNEAIAQMRSRLSTVRLMSLGWEMTEKFGGNVDLMSHPVVDATTLAGKGWAAAGGDSATVFSAQFGIDDAAGTRREILVTPILPDGSVLSKEELDAYVGQTLDGAEDILKADSLGIVIGVDVDPDGAAADTLQRLQEAFYDLQQNAAENRMADEQITRAMQVAAEKKNAELSQFDTSEAQGVARNNDFLKQLFGDYSSMSFASLRELIAQARQLRDALAGNGSAEGVTFLAADELERIKSSPAELEKLRKALDKLVPSGKGKAGNKWEGIFSTFKEGLAKLNKVKSFEDLSGAFGTIGGAAASAAGELATFYDAMGDTQAAETVRGVQQALSAVANIGQGFAQGGVIGGVVAVVGEAMNLMGKAVAAQARHREALKEIERAELDFLRQYNLALWKQNLLMEEATSIFGERKIAKAAQALDNYRQILGQLNQELAGPTAQGKAENARPDVWSDRIASGALPDAALAYEAGMGGLWDAEIVTGHKKTGLFGWGKGKDVYSSLLSVYPKLIDANGELDTAMLQTILDTQKMSDETRSYLENLIELKEAAEEADQALEDYLSDTFGSLGDGMLDAITTALKGGDDALATFAGHAASVFEELGEQIIYSLFFADKFAELQQELKKVYGSGKSEEEIAYDAMQLIDGFFLDVESDMAAAQQFGEEWKRRAAEKGYNLWTPDEAAQRGNAGAFTTMSQEQGTKLEGLFTSLQLHGASLDEKMDNVTAGLSGSLDALYRIAKNTDTLPLMLALWQAVQRDGLKVK